MILRNPSPHLNISSFWNVIHWAFKAVATPVSVTDDFYTFNEKVWKIVQLLIITEIASDRKSGVKVINMASKYTGYSVEFIVTP